MDFLKNDCFVLKTRKTKWKTKWSFLKKVSFSKTTLEIYLFQFWVPCICMREKEENCYNLTFCLFLVPRAPLPLVLRLEPPLLKTRTVRWIDATTVRVVAGSSSTQCQECKMEILGKTNTFQISPLILLVGFNEIDFMHTSL